MKKLAFLLLLFCACNLQAQNLIYNGSFEQNNVISTLCKTELSNTDYNYLMDYSAAFSVYRINENSIFFRSCLTIDSTMIPEGIAYDNNYSVLLDNIDTIFGSTHYERYTALSLELSQNLQIGVYYKLSYYQKIFPNIGGSIIIF